MLEGLVKKFVKVGRLRIVYPSGRVGEYGDGSGPEVALRLKDRLTLVRLALAPEMALGDCYMDGALVLEAGEIYDLLDLIGRNFAHDPIRRRPQSALRRHWFRLLRRSRQINDRVRARRNVSHHYDLSNDLYRRFLDADMQYSCAFFAEPNFSLEEAQAAKKALIASKLRLGPDQRVLDIGCGWGGLGLTLADRTPGGEVIGVTLSEAQLEVARERAQRARSAARFELCDYRDVKGCFDRIVSVGMLEHVGQPNYQAFFDAVARLLKEDGVAVIHAIGRRDEPGLTNPWVAKHIFPGGYIPALSEILPAVERAGLWVTDIEILRLHYAETLKCWRERFLRERRAIEEAYDARFVRMFEYYFAVSEVAFRYGGHMVFQLQLAKRVDALPLTRAYMDDEGAARAPRAPSLSAVGG